MASSKFHTFITGIMASFCILASTTAIAKTSLVGTELKLYHVLSKKTGADVSESALLKAESGKPVTAKIFNRAYTVTVTDSLITINFTRTHQWGQTRALFNGLVIDDITWPNLPGQKIANVRLDSRIPGVTEARSDISANSVQIDFRGLATKAGDSIAVEIETSSTGTAKP